MADRDDRNRDRSSPSWREIDALREKSNKRERDPMQKASSPAAINAQKSYRAALERAFANGKLDELAKTLSGASDRRPEVRLPAAAPPPAAPEHTPTPLASAPPAASATQTVETPKSPEREQKQKLLGKLREAEGREPINKACDAFLSKYPQLPDDFEILTKALSHRDDDRVRQTLAQLTKLMDRDKPRRGRALIAQLRILEDTHTEPDIRAQAAAVRGRL